MKNSSFWGQFSRYRSVVALISCGFESCQWPPTSTSCYFLFWQEVAPKTRFLAPLFWQKLENSAFAHFFHIYPYVFIMKSNFTFCLVYFEVHYFSYHFLSKQEVAQKTGYWGHFQDMEALGYAIVVIREVMYLKIDKQKCRIWFHDENIWLYMKKVSKSWIFQFLPKKWG